MKYKIEKGLPVPKTCKGVDEWTPLFNSMDVGDSIAMSAVEYASFYAYIHRLKLGELLRRTVGDDEVRVWRTK